MQPDDSLAKGNEMNKQKILIADDESEFLDLLKMILEGKGFEVCTTHDGEEALKMFKEDPPDVVLLDIDMPKLNGINTLKAIRDDDRDVPIFMLTAFMDGEWIKAAKESGASGFILKMYDLQKAIEQITNMLEFRRKSHG